MGFYLRKALSFGPFRFNLSRSGVGVSVGVKGARIGINPRGQTYIHAGRGGVYYRQTLSPGSPRPKTGSSPPSPQPRSSVEGAAASDLKDSSSDAVLQELNRVHARYQAVPIAVVVVALGLLGFGGTIGSEASLHPALRVVVMSLACLTGLCAILYARHLDATNGTATMHFELSDGVDRRFDAFLKGFAGFSSSEKIWHINAREATEDWKRSAGATTLVSRVETGTSLSAPPRVRTNIDVPALRSGGQTLYFFPDRLLVYDRAGVGAVGYGDLCSEIDVTKFREEGSVPSDARTIGTTWRYVNKNGGPDRRFNANREVPIVEYGQIRLRSTSGLDQAFQTSRSDAPRQLAEGLSEMAKNSLEPPETTRPRKWRVVVDRATAMRQAPVLKEACPDVVLAETERTRSTGLFTLGSDLTLEQANVLMLKLDGLNVPSQKQLYHHPDPFEPPQPKQPGEVPLPEKIPLKGVCRVCGMPVESFVSEHAHCVEASAYGGQEARLFASEVAKAVRELQGPFDAGKEVVPGATELFSKLEKGGELGHLIFGIAVVIISGKRITAKEAVLLRALRKEFGPHYSEAEETSTIELLRKIYDEHWVPLATSFRPVLDGLLVFIAPFEAYDVLHGSATLGTVRALLFRVANVVAKADGRVTQREEKLLDGIKQKLWTSAMATSSDQEKDPSPEAAAAPVNAVAAVGSSTEASASLEQLLEELSSLVGLATVKDDVKELVNFVKIQELRRARGLPVVDLSHHLVFTGNPGTGKTTVARLVAGIYRALGLLSKGHLVETDRSGLVAGYVGQTAIKTRQIAESAVGGVLFIDEAYGLAGRNGQDYGGEAIEILLKFMEDRRSDFVVIAAGYPTRMQDFLHANPGLQSRFSRQLKFDNYSVEELLSIFEVLCRKAHYSVSSSARDKVRGVVAAAIGNADETFGNARFVRNLFEEALRNQANRLVSLADVGMATLTTLEAADISNS